MVSQYLTFLYCFLYIYRSFNFAIANVVPYPFLNLLYHFYHWFHAPNIECNSCRSFSLANAKKGINYWYSIAFKSEKERAYCNSWKRDEYIKSNQERKNSKMEAKKIKSDNYTRSNMKMNNFMALKLFCILGAPILFSRT